jgi:GDPmannose 4,6-dehydratase
MWLMLNTDTPEDYVVATGINHSVQELINFAFEYIDKDFNDYLELNDDFYRESETIPLCGDSSMIEKNLVGNKLKHLKRLLQI